MKLFDKPLFNLTLLRNDASTAVLLSALGISDIGTDWRVMSDSITGGYTVWSSAYCNTFNCNPLRDEWAACKWLVLTGLLNQGPVVKTDFWVSERGLRYLHWYAKRAKDDNLIAVLNEVDLGK